jgi:hypothetical protein
MRAALCMLTQAVTGADKRGTLVDDMEDGTSILKR